MHSSRSSLKKCTLSLYMVLLLLRQHRPTTGLLSQPKIRARAFCPSSTLAQRTCANTFATGHKQLSIEPPLPCWAQKESSGNQYDGQQTKKEEVIMVASDESAARTKNWVTGSVLNFCGERLQWTKKCCSFLARSFNRSRRFKSWLSILKGKAGMLCI